MLNHNVFQVMVGKLSQRYFSIGGINNQVQHPTGKVPRWASTMNN